MYLMGQWPADSKDTSIANETGAFRMRKAPVPSPFVAPGALVNVELLGVQGRVALHQDGLAGHLFHLL